jgi:hypothetical protein
VKKRFLLLLFSYIGQKANRSGPFDFQGKFPLMLYAGAGDAPGQDLAPLGGEPPQSHRVFVVDFGFLRAKPAHLFLKKDFFPGAVPPLVALYWHILHLTILTVLVFHI